MTESGQGALEVARIRLRDPWLAFPALIALGLALTLWLNPEINRRLFAGLNDLARGSSAPFWLFATLAGDTTVVLALLTAMHWRRPLAIRSVPLTLLIVTLRVHIPKPLVMAWSQVPMHRRRDIAPLWCKILHFHVSSRTLPA